MTRRVWIAAGFAVAYFYCFPYFARLRSANEVPRVALTQEIVDRHTFRLDARWAELQQGSTFDIATTPDGHHFSNKAPGASLVAVPAYTVLRLFGEPSPALATWVFRVAAATLPSLLFLPWFLVIARRFGDERSAGTALVAYGLGSMAYPYALLFYSHALAAACAGGGFAAAVLVARGGARRPALTAVAVGLLLGLSVLADYQSILAAAVVGVYLAVLAPRRVPWAALGAAPPALLLLGYHAAAFGSPFRTGYSYAVDPAHKLGLLGIVGPNRAAFWNALLAPDNGLITLMPWVLLAAVGAWFALRDRARRAEAVACTVIFVGYVLFLGSLVPEFGRAGWSIGPRYMMVALPFVGWLAAAGLRAAESRPVPRLLAHATVLVGVIVCVVAATTYPHWPTAFRNPLYQVSFRALSEGLAPRSLGTAVGLRGLLSLLPLYAVVGCLVVAYLVDRDLGRLRTTLGAAVLAVAVVVGYRAFTPVAAPPPEKWGYVRSTWEP